MKIRFSQLSNLLTVLLFISVVGCSANTIPAGLKENVWLPESAKKIKYTMVRGTHQVRFADNVCFPARDFINELVGKMSQKGWLRQDTDFLNPGLKLNHKRGVGLWSHIVDEKDAYDNYRWTEDFADSAGNIVRYWLQYRVKQKTNGNDTMYQIKSCDLEVLTIYYPKETRQ
jgi:hypothetical protein